MRGRAQHPGRRSLGPGLRQRAARQPRRGRRRERAAAAAHRPVRALSGARRALHRRAPRQAAHRQRDRGHRAGARRLPPRGRPGQPALAPRGGGHGALPRRDAARLRRRVRAPRGADRRARARADRVRLPRPRARPEAARADDRPGLGQHRRAGAVGVRPRPAGRAGGLALLRDQRPRPARGARPRRARARGARPARTPARSPPAGPRVVAGHRREARHLRVPAGPLPPRHPHPAAGAVAGWRLPGFGLPRDAGVCGALGRGLRDRDSRRDRPQGQITAADRPAALSRRGPAAAARPCRTLPLSLRRPPAGGAGSDRASPRPGACCARRSSPRGRRAGWRCP